MNSKHLTSDSACPEGPDEGKLRIYGCRFSPFCHRVLLVGEAKGIPLDVVNINFTSKPEWLIERNPEGKVPIIDTPNGPLYESVIISQYIDGNFPGRELTASEPYQKAIDQIWIGNFLKVADILFQLMTGTGDDGPTNTERIRLLVEALDPFEAELGRRGTLYFGGATEPGMVDYMIWPWMERLPALKILYPDLYDFEEGKTQHPNLENWRKAMKEDAAVKTFFIPAQTHHDFIQSFVAGSPNFDMLEEVEVEEASAAAPSDA